LSHGPRFEEGVVIIGRFVISVGCFLFCISCAGESEVSPPYADGHLPADIGFVEGGVRRGDGSEPDSFRTDGRGTEGFGPVVCQPGALRCQGDASQVCSDDGLTWVEEAVCLHGCYNGWCVEVVDGGIVAGEIIADGRKVVLRGTVKIAPFPSVGTEGAGGVRIRADEIVIEGVLDGSGSGYPAGGGGGGGGGGCRQAPHGNVGFGGGGATPGDPGGAANECGSEKFGGPGGNGGVGYGQWAGTPGSGGICNTPTYSHPGQPGGPGTAAGYAGAGTNGDSSEDDEVWLGSSGGGGGGGSGGGNGNGEGGGGGGGGGAGGRGGASIELIASVSLVVQGTVTADGLWGGNGEDGESNTKTGDKTGQGGDGGDGGDGDQPESSLGGKGGSHEGSGTDGGTGGDGGPGAGGGILLYCGGTDGISLTGKVSTLGGGGNPANGGTLKIRYRGQKPGGELLAGRVHFAQLEQIDCSGDCPGLQTCDDATGLCVEPDVCQDDIDCLGSRVCVDGTCQPASSPPIVTITQPEDGQATSGATIQVTGTASDDAGIVAVQHRVNGGDWSGCAGTSEWTCDSVSLAEGNNLIEVRAEDTDGLFGADTVSVVLTGGTTEYDIFSIQRELEFAAGKVTIEGNRFYVNGEEYYPKTDFLTAVYPGDDIIGFTTHCYLSQSSGKKQTLADALVESHYNSIYIYTLNQGDYGGGGNSVTPYGSGGWSFDTEELNSGRINQWKADVEELINSYHLKPFLWLAADDSGDIANAGMGKWQTYLDHMVGAFEEYPIVWVLGLEVDEYWSAGEVSERRAHLQSKTSHPVGVHLTTSETKKANSSYKDGFDFVMVQFGSPQDNGQYIFDVNNYVLNDRPYVAAEFNVKGKGSGGEAEPTVYDRSKAIGKVIAGIGTPSEVAGIGNGILLTQEP